MSSLEVLPSDLTRLIIKDSLLDLPTDLLKSIIKVLYDSKDKDSFNAAMQTCSAMRLMCSRLITKLVVKGLSALQTFPRNAVTKTLRLEFSRSADTARWLESARQAADIHRLSHVARVEVTPVTPDSDDTSSIFPDLARVFPTILSLEVVDYVSGMSPGYRKASPSLSLRS